jgi:hypothetical protein
LSQPSTRPHPSRPAAKSVAELIAGAIDPLVRKRGLARAELLAWWPDIVGETYAASAMPERIRWTRDGTAATLIVRCDPAVALQFSYEAEQVRARLNGYFGYSAVGAIRIVQQPVGRGRRAGKTERAVTEERALPAAVEGRLEGLAAPLRDSLRALGKAVLAGS